jgi:hypothetical protein
LNQGQEQAQEKTFDKANLPKDVKEYLNSKKANKK